MKINLTFIVFLTILLCYGQESVTVVRVIDGDTFEIENGERVRMIGINAPELSDIYGIDAKLHLTKLIENENVTLVRDQLTNDKDRYQRLLRYAYFNDEDINKRMIDDGFAFAYLKFKFTKSNEYRNTQLQSKENGLGIWSHEKNTDFIDKTDNDRRSGFFDLPPKAYLAGVLIFVLVIIGIVYYYKK